MKLTQLVKAKDLSYFVTPITINLILQAMKSE